MPEYKILVAEDDETLQSVLKYSLTEESYTVLAANDGLQRRIHMIQESAEQEGSWIQANVRSGNLEIDPAGHLTHLITLCGVGYKFEE